MDEAAEVPEPAQERDGFSAVAIALSLFAVLIAVWGVALGWRAIDESKASAGDGAAAEPVTVSETEFSIAAVTAGVGGSLHVTNDGSVAHNLAIEGTDLKTGDLQSGDSESLELGDLAAGTYTMYCQIPGHRESGMEATLTVSADGSVSTDGSMAGNHGDEMDYDAMTQAMLDSMSQFPAETEGVGNAELAPTEVKADGTKVFDLVAEIAPWERAPGDVVQAWTYNGIVPGPSIHLELGDQAEFRVKNELPIATDMHSHGLNMDNQFDGVAPITQDLILPGETFTYEYTADEPAVAMYHPHFHSQIGMPNGMFGTIFVGHLPLPTGQTIGGIPVPADVTVAQELPMVLDDSGVIGYSLNGKSFPATSPIVGKKGDWLLIHYYNGGSQSHPMHLHQFEQIVVAKDGFPLDHPYLADTINVAPGERYSVLVQLDKVGTWVWHCHILPHVEDENGMFGMVTAVVVTDS